jgi:hypothetical protein
MAGQRLHTLGRHRVPHLDRGVTGACSSNRFL